MDAENFAYWLQGFFEMTDAAALSPNQVLMIKEHLKLVFEKKTPNIKPGLINREIIDPDNPNRWWLSEPICSTGVITGDTRLPIDPNQQDVKVAYSSFADLVQAAKNTNLASSLLQCNCHGIGVDEVVVGQKESVDEHSHAGQAKRIDMNDIKTGISHSITWPGFTKSKTCVSC